MLRFSAITFAIVMVFPQASSAQTYDPDPWRWSQQTNEDGFRQACNSARNRYNTYVNFYRNAQSENERRQWRLELDAARQDMQRYCSR